MRIYLTPRDGTGRVVICSTHEAIHAVLELFKLEGVTEVDAVRGDAICDFCSHPEVHFMYSVEPGGIIHDLSSEQHGDHDGLWAACDVCYNLISSNDWPGLLDRSVNHFSEMNPEIAEMAGREFIVSLCAVAHTFFKGKYDGTPPVTMKTDTEWLTEHGISGGN